MNGSVDVDLSSQTLGKRADVMRQSDGGKPIWAGYMMKDSCPPTELNQCDPRPANDDSCGVLRNLDTPAIHFIVEDGDAPGE